MAMGSDLGSDFKLVVTLKYKLPHLHTQIHEYGGPDLVL